MLQSDIDLLDRIIERHDDDTVHQFDSIEQKMQSIEDTFQHLKDTDRMVSLELIDKKLNYLIRVVTGSYNFHIEELDTDKFHSQIDKIKETRQEEQTEMFNGD